MAKVLEHVVPSQAIKRALVIVEDAWLRFRLQRELERVGCEVVPLSRLRPDDLREPAPYDVVLTDAALLPEGSRLEALRALRTTSPQARFVLLVGPEERAVTEQAQRSGFDLVLPRPTRVELLPALVERALAQVGPPLEAVPVPIRFQFMLEPPTGTGKRKTGSAVTSVLVHVFVLGALLLVPMIYTETLDVRELTQSWLVAPPPPPPPPPAAPAEALQARKIKPVLQTLQGKLIAPTVIPKEITRIVDSAELQEGYGVLGGVPGGVPGGQLGGVLGGVLGGIPSAVRGPVPPAPMPQKPVRVGGNIRPPRLIRRAEPEYPTLAKQARIQGDVRIDAIIDTSGRVVEMKVLSGHPLLVQSALDAVRQWVYEPTRLNEQPVAVVLEVTVYFRLH